MPDVVVTHCAIQLGLQIILGLILKLVFRSYIDGLSIDIVSQYAEVLRELFTQSSRFRRCRWTSPMP